jgi:hypothetical protein
LRGTALWIIKALFGKLHDLYKVLFMSGKKKKKNSIENKKVILKNKKINL